MYRYFQNPFMTATEGNLKKALIMGRDHYDRLYAQKDTDAMLYGYYEEMKAVYETFQAAYSYLNVIEGRYKGHTKIVEDLMDVLMKKKIKQWDIKIQNVYLNDTPQYTMLLPDGRSPFQKGAYDLRINAIHALRALLEEYDDLTAVWQDVADFYVQLDTARTAQQELEGLVKGARLALEKNRVELCITMHGIFGGLLYRHRRNPQEMTRYYDMKYLKTPATAASPPVTETKIEAMKKTILYENLLTEHSYLRLKNTGKTPLVLFAALDSAAPKPPNALLLAPKTSRRVYVSELASGADYQQLIVLNLGNQTGSLRSSVEEVE